MMFVEVEHEDFDLGHKKKVRRGPFKEVVYDYDAGHYTLVGITEEGEEEILLYLHHHRFWHGGTIAMLRGWRLARTIRRAHEILDACS